MPPTVNILFRARLEFIATFGVIGFTLAGEKEQPNSISLVRANPCFKKKNSWFPRQKIKIKSLFFFYHLR